MKHVIRALPIVGALCSLAVGVHSVTAHHSTTMFDHSKTLTIRGEVVELRWVNPHATVSVDGVINAGEQPATWLLEMTSPGNLVRAGGWTRSAVKKGDQVTIDFSPLREPGAKGGALKKLTLVSTGQVFTSNIRDQERPGLE